MAAGPITLAGRLATTHASLRFVELPDEVVRWAKQCLLDQLGVQIAGATLPWTVPYRRMAARLGGAGPATVVGAPSGGTSGSAAFLNAILGHSCEFDDLLMIGGGHPGSVIVPAALATAEETGADGAAFLAAVVAGYDTMCRVADCIHPRQLERGFQSTGLAGPFGAAVASGLLLGLDAGRMTHALGISGSYCTGLTEYDQTGGESKRLNSAMAARAGLEAAFAAAAGLTGPPTILEGRKGMFRSFIGEVDPAPLLDGLGRAFRIVPWFKANPCTLTILSSVDALGAILNAHGLTAGDIAKVSVFVSPAVKHHGGTITRPTDVAGAQFSLHFSLALLAVRGRTELKAYLSPETLADPAIHAVIDRIEVVASEPVKRHFPSRVVVETFDGRVFEHVQEHVRGSPKNPLSQVELEEKFDGLVAGILPADTARTIKELVRDLEGLPSLAPLAGLLSFDGATRAAA